MNPKSIYATRIVPLSTYSHYRSPKEIVYRVSQVNFSLHSSKNLFFKIIMIMKP